jgi:uncharacterized phosphosugar-binding protein
LSEKSENLFEITDSTSRAGAVTASTTFSTTGVAGVAGATSTLGAVVFLEAVFVEGEAAALALGAAEAVLVVLEEVFDIILYYNISFLYCLTH